MCICVIIIKVVCSLFFWFANNSSVFSKHTLCNLLTHLLGTLVIFPLNTAELFTINIFFFATKLLAGVYVSGLFIGRLLCLGHDAAEFWRKCCGLETSATDYPATRLHIPAEQKPQMSWLLDLFHSSPS